MRKTPYLISLVVALATLALTIVSISLPKWLHVPHPDKSLDLTYIGLYERCDLRQTVPAPPYDPKDPDPTLPLPPNTPSKPLPEPQSISYMFFYLHTRPSANPPVSDPTRPDNPVPPPEDKLPPKKENIKYKCKPFPSRTACDHDGQSFCVLWTTAAYAMQLSIVFAVVVLVVLFVVSFRFSTRARRRGAWKIVGGLTGLQVALQIATMAIIVYLRQTRPSWFSDNVQYGASFILLVISWSTSFLLMLGLVGTGFAARAGHKWAAGKRGYHPIPDAH